MEELTIEQKIAEIKNTNTYQDVKNAWFPPYYEKEYYFVSYSHKDYKLVYESLHRLQSGEKRLSLWYDHNLTPGRDWEIEARRYIYDFNCKGVIFFLSENAVLSQSIHKEIEFVKNSGKSYLSINLPCEKIEGHAGEYLSAAQMLEQLKQQGYEIENYDEKSVVLNETFNSNITYLQFNQEIELQIDKILSLKRQPLLNIYINIYINGYRRGRVTSINDINVTEIKKEDFEYFDEEVQCKGVVYRIEKCAFANCRYLSKVELPESIEYIGEFVFYNCASLTNITIPDSVTSIEDGAFEYCTSLTSVIIPDSVTSIEDGAFGYCESLTSINFGKNSKLETISDYVFAYCTSLTSITIPDSVTSIGDGAFECCTSLTSVIIPDSVTSIGDGAFGYCGSLKNVIFGNNSKLETIGMAAFDGCTNLTSIAIPNSVISIDFWAFDNCTSLKDIFYKGTKLQWKSIDKDNNWDKDTPDYTVHCTDGDLKKGEF